jgi:hypothetical protein
MHGDHDVMRESHGQAHPAAWQAAWVACCTPSVVPMPYQLGGGPPLHTPNWYTSHALCESM